MKSMQAISQDKLRANGAVTPDEVADAMWEGLLAWEAEFYEHGLDDGEAWTREAPPAASEYAATKYVEMAKLPAVTQHEPTDDPILGEFFKAVFDKYRANGLEYEQTGPFTRIPNGLWQRWEQGFLESVRAYRRDRVT